MITSDIMRLSFPAATLLAGLAIAGCDSNTPSNNSGGITQVDLEALANAVGCTTVASISSGQTRDGSLSMEDCDHFNFGNVSKLDYFGFTLSEFTAVQIDLASNELDMYLYLFDSQGTILFEDDDTGGGVLGFDSQILETLDPGLYAIGVNTYVGEPTIGDYSLDLFVSGQ